MTRVVVRDATNTRRPSHISPSTILSHSYAFLIADSSTRPLYQQPRLLPSIYDPTPLFISHRSSDTFLAPKNSPPPTRPSDVKSFQTGATSAIRLTAPQNVLWSAAHFPKNVNKGSDWAMCEIAWSKGYFGSNMQLVSYVSTTRLGCIWVNWQRLGGYFGGGNGTLGTEVMD
jgi:hypothetical protein